MDYTEILSRAWKITWNNKILWVFGFLAGLASGSGGGSGGGSGRGGGGGPSGGGEFGPGNLPPDIERQLERPEVIGVIIGVACLLIIIAIVAFVLSIIGRGGLIGGIRLADDTGKVAFGEAWAVGRRYFWRLFGIELLLAVAGLVVGAMGAATGLIGAFTLGIGLCFLLPVLCVLILALIPLSITAHFARFGVVVEDKPVMDAFRRGWELLKANLGPIIVLGAILIVISIIAGLVLVLPFFAIVFPTIFAFMLNPEDPNWVILGASGLAFLCYLPIAIVLGSILETWQTSAWTLAYRRFIGSAPAAPVAAPPPPPTPFQPA
ncbi:MAG: hypothetical protein FJ030_12160 [Chloroflexi bacterium]|nr:hypothetical protein [Chloroflexota bacterium]